jgi:hypothetical protein
MAEMNLFMDVRAIAIASSLSVSLLTFLPILKIDYPFAKASTSSQQTQETVINLSAADLKKSLVFKVSSSQSLTQATGEIRLNGILLKKISRTTTQIELAPKLRRGRNTVVVLGQYSPASAAINVEFISSNNHISQSMAGSGTIKQTLAIEVE